jgi:hypothetical protein
MNRCEISLIRSFSCPPKVSILTVNCFCAILGKEESWKSFMGFFSRQYLKDKMMYDIDKSNFPLERFKKLEKYLESPELNEDNCKRVSLATYVIFKW